MLSTACCSLVMGRKQILNNSKGVSAYDLAIIRDNPDILKLFGIKVEGLTYENGTSLNEETKKLSRDKTRKSTISSPKSAAKLGKKKKSASGKKKKKRASEPPITQEGKMLEEV